MTVGIENFGRTGILTVNSVLLNCALVDVWRLEALEGNHVVKGRNREVAGVSGSRAKRWRYAEAEHSLPLRISGEVTDAVGTPTVGDCVAQLTTNRLALVELVCDPIYVDGAATVTASVVFPNGDTYEAEVQPSFEFGETVATQNRRHAFCNGVLRLVIPSGRFEPA